MPLETSSGDIFVPSSPMRTQYSVKTKLRLLNKLDASRESARSFARRKHIDHTLLLRWREDRQKLEKSNKDQLKIDSGRRPMCPEVEDELYGKVLDARADGLPIGYRWAAQTAKSLFLEINAEADPEPVPVFSNCWVRNFMQRYDLSVRRASSSRTQLNQDPAIMESFSEEIRELREAHGITDENIFNMDETAIFFDLSGSTTIDQLGARRVSIAKNYASKSRFTCVLTARANGTLAAPTIIFKGVNLPRNLQQIEGVQDIFMQKNAWMNSILMRQYVASPSLPGGDAMKILIIDKFTAHGDEKVLRILREKNYIVKFVPAGYTDLLQPLDVGVMKPFKVQMKRLFTDWLFERGIVDGKATCPSKELFCRWTANAVQIVPQ